MLSVDEFVFCCGKIMYVICNDDSIISFPDQREINQLIKYLKISVLDVLVESNIKYFLDLDINMDYDGYIYLTWPRLIEKIVNYIVLSKPRTHSRPTPSSSSKILFSNKVSEKFYNILQCQ